MKFIKCPNCKRDCLIKDEGIIMVLCKCGEIIENSKVCVLCGKNYTGYGNNADPLGKGLCCDECSVKVIIERLGEFI